MDSNSGWRTENEIWSFDPSGPVTSKTTVTNWSVFGGIMILKWIYVEKNYFKTYIFYSWALQKLYEKKINGSFVSVLNYIKLILFKFIHVPVITKFCLYKEKLKMNTFFKYLNTRVVTHLSINSIIEV